MGSPAAVVPLSASTPMVSSQSRKLSRKRCHPKKHVVYVCRSTIDHPALFSDNFLNDIAGPGDGVSVSVDLCDRFEDGGVAATCEAQVRPTKVKLTTRASEESFLLLGAGAEMFAVYLLCVLARDCSRSNQTMGCAHTWM